MSGAPGAGNARAQGGRPVAVIGAGAWGTALALLAAQNGHGVILWTREPAHAAEMAASRENARRLPGHPLPHAIRPVAEAGALGAAAAIVLAVPSRALGSVLGALAPHLDATAPAVIAAKGLDAATGRPLSALVSELHPGGPVLALSGPSFAADVARGLPTAVTLAGADRAAAEAVRAIFARPTFRIYLTDDLTGTETGGAAKNVLAIAAGIVEGRGLGASARAALIARGFAELGRLVEASGGRRETVAGLSGLGDLVLTCSSTLSRNFSFGLALGRGETVEAALAASKGVVEGAATAPVLLREAGRLGVDMPIAAAVAAVLDGRLSVDDAIEGLLARPAGREF